MKTFRVSAVFIFVLLALFCSCDKFSWEQNAQLKPLTTYNLSAYNGSQLLTFNATANGIDTGSNPFVSISGVWSPANENGDNYDLNFIVNPIAKGYVGNYSLGYHSNAQYHAYNTQVFAGYIFQYQTDSTHIGSFSITNYDSINKTISGTFSFTGVGGGSTQAAVPYVYPSTVTVINGVFTKIPM